MFSKVSLNDVFMHYFQNISACGGFTQDPHLGSTSGPRWETYGPPYPVTFPPLKILLAPMVTYCLPYPNSHARACSRTRRSNKSNAVDNKVVLQTYHNSLLTAACDFVILSNVITDN